MMLLFVCVVVNFRNPKRYDVLSFYESIPTPVFSIPEGIYDQPFKLEMKAPEGYTIYYSTDGSTPTTRSRRYRSSIHIDMQTNLNKNMLYIPTSLMWQMPRVRQNHSVVVRARCYKKNVGYGKVKNMVYSISDIKQYQGFHLIHILIESDSLFSPEKGIYVLGEKYYSKKALAAIEQNPVSIDWRKYPANYRGKGENWIRHGVAFLLLNLSGEKVFEQNVNISMNGNTSMAFPSKPLRIMPDNKSDTVIKYNFFDELPYSSYSILLRNSGSDTQYTVFRDALMSQLAKETRIDTRSYAPSVVYINGNYWGIHNIREKNDEFFLAAKYESPLQNITRITYRRPEEQKINYDKHIQIKHSSDHHAAHSAFVDLINYIRQNSMAERDAYNYVATQIDVDNFIEYVILQTYFANLAWGRTNVKFYRIDRQTEIMKEKGIDAGKWRWLLCDLDDGMHCEPSFNMFEWLCEGYAQDAVTQIFYGFLENDEFKEKFIDRYEYLIKNHLSTEKMLEQIHLFESRYQAEIERHIARWGFPSSFRFWQQEVEHLKEFARRRPEIVLEQLKEL